MAGTHALINLYGCRETEISRIKEVKKKLYEIVNASSLKPLSHKFHQFKPSGVTGIILLSESHISIHTWPEKKFAAIDIFSCSGKNKAKKASEMAIKCFAHKKSSRKIVKR